MLRLPPQTPRYIHAAVCLRYSSQSWNFDTLIVTYLLIQVGVSGLVFCVNKPNHACAVVCYTQGAWVSSPSTQWHRKDAMPKSSLHVFIWSEKYQRYELQSHGHPNQWFHPGDELAFTRWLEEHTSFAFVGQAGRLSVIKEGRSGGRGYWNAYHKQARPTHKVYLELSAQLPFTRSDGQARSLHRCQPSPTPPPDP